MIISREPRPKETRAAGTKTGAPKKAPPMMRGKDRPLMAAPLEEVDIKGEEREKRDLLLGAHVRMIGTDDGHWCRTLCQFLRWFFVPHGWTL